MASSDTEATSGMVRMPTPMPAASMLPPRPFSSPNRLPTMFGAIHARAKKPRTTDGTPASTSRMGLRKERTRGRANSDEVHRRSEPERHRHDHGDAGHDQAADDQRADAEVVLARVPRVAGEDLAPLGVRDELPPLAEQRDHNGGADDDRERGSGEEQSADRPFAAMPPSVTGQVELRRASGRVGGGGHACLTRGVDVGGGGPGRTTRPPGLRSVWRPSSTSPVQRPSQAAVVALSWSAGSGT